MPGNTGGSFESKPRSEFWLSEGTGNSARFVGIGRGPYLLNLTAAGFERVSEETGHTFFRGPLKLTLDHIFSKGLLALEAGVWRESTASDHYPIWVEYELPA